VGLNPKVIITRLMKLLQNPDYIEELRAKLELLRGFKAANRRYQILFTRHAAP